MAAAHRLLSELTIYKIVPAAVWREAETAGRFHGSPADLQDGFIHFSTAAQVHETAEKHFADVPDLLLVAIETQTLEGPDLRWEPSRGGEPFPHLYAHLPLTTVRWVKPLPIGLLCVSTLPAQ